jgi:hypothetical protein
VGGLSHYLEEEGLATTQISLIREHTERINPPRALWVPFELGRPLGAPNDDLFQKRVLMAALGLLEASTGPLLVDFPEDAPSSGDFTGWACPLNLVEEKGERAVDLSLSESLKREMDFLRPWYDVAVQNNGRTTAGVSGLEIQEAADFLVGFINFPGTPSPRPELPLGEVLKLASEDLKAYYFESAAAQSGEANSKQIADWFWKETEAGRMLFDLQKVCLGSNDPAIKMMGTMLLIPRNQAHLVP